MSNPEARLTAALDKVDNSCGQPDCMSHIDEALAHEDGYQRIAHNLLRADPTFAADLALAEAVREALKGPGWPHEYHRDTHEPQCRACGWLAIEEALRDDAAKETSDD